MNLFEKILFFLQGAMERPVAFGWFHLLCIGLTIISILFLYKKKKNYNEKQLKIVLATYGIIAFILELIKQIIWSFNYDPVTSLVTWDYQWYIAPFQLCTTPIYVSLICLLLKKNKLRDLLLSYMAFYTILGGFITIVMPDSCFVETVLVNVHTMWLHCGSFVVSVYLMLTEEIKLEKKNLLNAFLVFLGFVFLAEILNMVIYNSGILNGDTFNMFYISPYFISELPVFNFVQEHLPFIGYLLVYISALFLGSNIVYGIASIIKSIKAKISI